MRVGGGRGRATDRPRLDRCDGRLGGGRVGAVSADGHRVGGWGAERKAGGSGILESG